MFTPSQNIHLQTALTKWRTGENQPKNITLPTFSTSLEGDKKEYLGWQPANRSEKRIVAFTLDG